MRGDRERWEDKHQDPEFELPDDPIPELERRIDTLPRGRALDVATGTGRNALYLAAAGYEVDAIDVSYSGLWAAKERGTDRDLSVNWIQADTDSFVFPDQTYAVITVSFYAALNLLPELKAALEPGGVLIYEHHLRTGEDVPVGPSNERHRFRSNDLLHACLDLTVLHYEEQTRIENDSPSAVATVVARKTHGGSQVYPQLDD